MLQADPQCGLTNAEVIEGFACLLNQTSISTNDNKFYIIQALRQGNTHYCFTRWGRVGAIFFLLFLFRSHQEAKWASSSSESLVV